MKYSTGFGCFVKTPWVVVKITVYVILTKAECIDSQVPNLHGWSLTTQKSFFCSQSCPLYPFVQSHLYRSFVSESKVKDMFLMAKSKAVLKWSLCNKLKCYDYIPGSSIQVPPLMQGRFLQVFILSSSQLKPTKSSVQWHV